MSQVTDKTYTSHQFIDVFGFWHIKLNNFIDLSGRGEIFNLELFSTYQETKISLVVF